MYRQEVLTLLLGGLAGIGAASAQQGMIRIVVPYAAGGTTDTMARLLALFLQKKLGRSVIVESRPGAAGLIATRYVQSAPPDGNTLLFHNSGIVVLPLIEKSASYDIRKDFTPVCSIADGPNFLMVNDTVPAKTCRSSSNTPESFRAAWNAQTPASIRVGTSRLSSSKSWRA